MSEMGVKHHQTSTKITNMVQKAEETSDVSVSEPWSWTY